MGISDEPVTLDTYRELLGNEAELIGSNDHLLSELPTVIEMARRGILDTARVVSRTIPLEAARHQRGAGRAGAGRGGHPHSHRAVTAVTAAGSPAASAETGSGALSVASILSRSSTRWPWSSLWNAGRNRSPHAISSKRYE